MITTPLDYVPFWAIGIATVVVIYLSVEIGYQCGRRRRRATEVEKEATIGPVVGATLGLLAFMLAFTFGLAATRFDARRQIIVSEANAVGTTYLRAGFLPEPYCAESRQLLRRYAEVRVAGATTGKIDQAVTESLALHEQLWQRAEAASQHDAHSIFVGLYVQSLNQLIDLHSERVLVGLRSRIPIVIWVALYCVAVLAMAEIGYQAGLAGSRRSPVSVLLVLTFSLVMLLIMDLDRPTEGLLNVSQQAMIDVQHTMTMPSADPREPDAPQP